MSIFLTSADFSDKIAEKFKEKSMLFEPDVDKLVEMVGNRYIAAVIIGARAKYFGNQTNLLFNGNTNLAINQAANEIANGELTGVQSK